ncbi:S-layer homology domain-containing protein [Lysinibacillus sp. LZ02]|uniref:S-layer homology domain-containing protein n=1 Tax=Lysinibacillus sp. LZ02 TaxID=3420668 RepID=UPI003D36571C
MKQNKRSYKWLSSVTAMTMVTMAGVPVVNAALLTDIKGYKYEQSIKKLYEQGIISGYGNNTYLPNKTLSRSDVVKILGKYLIGLGYQIPNNYKHNMRFYDLKTSSDDELLQYAALVYDHGIFVGSQGNLNPHSTITHEQAALVIVRALSKIDNFDYVSYIESQRYLQEYLDIELATEEAQRSINVFDYYDVTIDDNYYPKQHTTRGEFAHYLYSMLNIESPVRNNESVTIKKLTVVSDERLDVTLSTGVIHHIQLEEPLPENIPTEVSFVINGVRFTEIVEYKVDNLQINNVENINGGQFVIYFNQPVNLAETYLQSDLDKFIKLTSIDKYYSYGSGTVPLQRGELSEDGRSYKITISSNIPLSKRYRLQILGVHGVNGTSLPDYDDVVYFYDDTTQPTIEAVESISANKVKVIFSEPINRNYYTSAQFKLRDATNVTGITMEMSRNTTEIIFDLTSARAKGSLIEVGTAIDVTFSTIRDLAGNYSDPTPLTVTIVKGQHNGIAPTLEKVEQLGAKKMKLTFNEELSMFRAYDLSISSNSTNYYIENIEIVKDEPSTYILTVNDYLRGNVTIATAKGRYIMDTNGETGTFSVKHNFEYDAGTARIVRTEVVRENNLEYLYIEFDRNISLDDKAVAAITGTYTDGLRTVPINNSNVKVRRVYGEPKAVRIALRELLDKLDVENTTYDVNISFKNVENEYKEAVENGALSFIRSKDYAYNGEKLEVVSVNTSRTSSAIKDPQIIVVDFNYPVDERLASLPYYYEVEGYNIEKVQVNPTNPKQVLIKLGSRSASHNKPYFYITKLRAANSYIEMDYYYEPIYLTESIKPVPDYWSPELKINHAKELQLTFYEAIAPIESSAFIVTDNFGTQYEAVAKNDSADAKNIILTLSKEVPRSATVTVKLKPNREIYDVYGNKGEFEKVTRTFYTIPVK